MLDRRRRGRRKGVTIRPGSVRQARTEAGLTLAQIAGNELSRAAIHLIETDRVRPSRETLDLIAERTQKPLEFFVVDSGSLPEPLEGQREIRELERLTATHEFASAVAKGTRLLEQTWSRETHAMIEFYVGQCYCRLLQPVPALDLLASARATFEQMGDHWTAVEAMDWESSAMALAEDPRAIPTAVDALQRCRRLRPALPSTEARILGHLAGMHVTAHSWSQALHYYEAAVEAAGSVKDLTQLARVHHGLATVYQRMGQPARASHHFDKALALYAIESELSAVYRVENDIGELLLRLGNLDSAEAHLRRALMGTDELGVDPKCRGYVLGNLAEVFLKKRDLATADDYANKALDAGRADGEEIVIANAELVQA